MGVCKPGQRAPVRADPSEPIVPSHTRSVNSRSAKRFRPADNGTRLRVQVTRLSRDFLIHCCHENSASCSSGLWDHLKGWLLPSLVPFFFPCLALVAACPRYFCCWLLWSHAEAVGGRLSAVYRCVLPLPRRGVFSTDGTFLYPRQHRFSGREAPCRAPFRTHHLVRPAWSVPGVAQAQAEVWVGARAMFAGIALPVSGFFSAAGFCLLETSLDHAEPADATARLQCKGLSRRGRRFRGRTSVQRPCAGEPSDLITKHILTLSSACLFPSKPNPAPSSQTISKENQQNIQPPLSSSSPLPPNMAPSPRKDTVASLVTTNARSSRSRSSSAFGPTRQRSSSAPATTLPDDDYDMARTIVHAVVRHESAARFLYDMASPPLADFESALKDYETAAETFGDFFSVIARLRASLAAARKQVTKAASNEIEANQLLASLSQLERYLDSQLSNLDASVVIALKDRNLLHSAVQATDERSRSMEMQSLIETLPNPLSRGRPREASPMSAPSPAPSDDSSELSMYSDVEGDVEVEDSKPDKGKGPELELEQPQQQQLASDAALAHALSVASDKDFSVASDVDEEADNEEEEEEEEQSTDEHSPASSSSSASSVPVKRIKKRKIGRAKQKKPSSSAKPTPPSAPSSGPNAAELRARALQLYGHLPAPEITQFPEFTDVPRRCYCCDSTSTPMYRHGPREFVVLCNACGVKWKRGQILPQYPHRIYKPVHGGAPKSAVSGEEERRKKEEEKREREERERERRERTARERSESVATGRNVGARGRKKKGLEQVKTDEVQDGVPVVEAKIVVTPAVVEQVPEPVAPITSIPTPVPSPMQVDPSSTTTITANEPIKHEPIDPPRTRQPSVAPSTASSSHRTSIKSQSRQQSISRKSPMNFKVAREEEVSRRRGGSLTPAAVPKKGRKQARSMSPLVTRKKEPEVIEYSEEESDGEPDGGPPFLKLVADPEAERRLRARGLDFAMPETPAVADHEHEFPRIETEPLREQAAREPFTPARRPSFGFPFPLDDMEGVEQTGQLGQVEAVSNLDMFDNFEQLDVSHWLGPASPPSTTSVQPEEETRVTGSNPIPIPGRQVEPLTPISASSSCQRMPTAANSLATLHPNMLDDHFGSLRSDATFTAYHDHPSPLTARSSLSAQDGEHNRIQVLRFIEDLTDLPRYYATVAMAERLGYGEALNQGIPVSIDFKNLTLNDWKDVAREIGMNQDLLRG